MSFGRNGFAAMSFRRNVLTDITERCVAILIKIYQNSEVTEQNLARLRLIQCPSAQTNVFQTQCPSDAMAFVSNYFNIVQLAFVELIELKETGERKLHHCSIVPFYKKQL